MLFWVWSSSDAKEEFRSFFDPDIQQKTALVILQK